MKPVFNNKKRQIKTFFYIICISDIAYNEGRVQDGNPSQIALCCELSVTYVSLDLVISVNLMLQGFVIYQT